MGRGQSCLSGAHEAEGWGQGRHGEIEVPEAVGNMSSRGEIGSALPILSSSEQDSH